MTRFDPLKAVANLAKNVTKWSANCDRSLHRLICYVNSSLNLRLKGHIGDSSDNLALSPYSDADFAGDKEPSKPTTYRNIYGLHRSEHCLSFEWPVYLRNRHASRTVHQRQKLSQQTQPFASKDCPHSNCETSH